MGAVDLVIQVESPKSVARGLQRIGRAGHELGAVSKGRIFPKFRADLLESAVVAERHARGRDRGDGDPAQPARRARPADRRDLRRGGDRGRRAARPRPRRLPVRRPLARPARERARHALRPLPVGRVRRAPSRASSGTAPPARSAARDGARRLAVTNAGTIPDRGLFGVHLSNGGGRVGELDEEMVYEARAGQTFLLGASTWRIEEITRDRVLVSPAPGVPGAVPFWKGEGVGRPYELGAPIGAASRELVGALAREGARAAARAAHARRPRRAEPAHLPARSRQAATGASRATAPSSSSGSATRSATGASASSRRSARRVHAPWAMAVGARLRDVARPRGAVDLVGRRDRVPPARRGRAAAHRGLLARPRRARGARRRRGGADGALRRAVPRERRRGRC